MCGEEGACSRDMVIVPTMLRGVPKRENVYLRVHGNGRQGRGFHALVCRDPLRSDPRRTWKCSVWTLVT